MMKAEKITNNDLIIQFKKYSDYILGYRIMVNDEPTFIINENIAKEKQVDVIERLTSCSELYEDYKFILLYGNYELYINNNEMRDFLC